MSDQQIIDFLRSDMTWHKPTQSFSSSDNFFKVLWSNALKDEMDKFKFHNDFNNIGCTLHKIDDDLDTGDIIYQNKLDIKKVKHIYNLRALTTEIAIKQSIDF